MTVYMKTPKKLFGRRKKLKLQPQSLEICYYSASDIKDVLLKKSSSTTNYCKSPKTTYRLL